MRGTLFPSDCFEFGWCASGRRLSNELVCLQDSCVAYRVHKVDKFLFTCSFAHHMRLLESSTLFIFGQQTRVSARIRPITKPRLVLRLQLERDYPLNLSILVSGGKETNQNSLSNGE